jgi:hypothetical protein
MARTTDDMSTIAERPYWTVRNTQARYEPVPGGWRATVRRLREPIGRGRYHVAIVDRTGVTRYASEASTLVEAVQSAERGVAARNALRLVRLA